MQGTHRDAWVGFITWEKQAVPLSNSAQRTALGNERIGKV
jgi:hypothetical protein